MGKPIKVEVNSERIRTAIKESGIKQHEIAARLNVNYQALNRRINQGKLSPLELGALCALLDCDPEYIKGKTDENQSYTAYQERNWKAGFDAARTAFKELEEHRPRISVSMDFLNGVKSYYLTCDHAPLDAVLTAIIQAGGYDELKANIQPLTAENVEALENAPKIYD